MHLDFLVWIKFCFKNGITDSKSFRTSKITEEQKSLDKIFVPNKKNILNFFSRISWLKKFVTQFSCELNSQFENIGFETGR